MAVYAKCHLPCICKEVLYYIIIYSTSIGLSKSGNGDSRVQSGVNVDREFFWSIFEDSISDWQKMPFRGNGETHAKH